MIDIEKFVSAFNNIKDYPTIASIGEALGISARQVRRLAQKCRGSGVVLVDRIAPAQKLAQEGTNVVVTEEDISESVVIENIKLAKALQKSRDKARITGAVSREIMRTENALEEFTRELIDGISKLKLSAVPKYHETKDVEHYGILHISDNHLNEQVDLPWNQFNWNVAAQRLQKHVAVAKKMCKAFGIKNVLVAFSGDLLNSDRRLDELMSNAGNRSQACLLAVDLYSQMLLDLNRDVNVTVASVTGNEARIPQNVGWSKLVASENYDFTINEILKRLLDSKGIRFFDSTDPSEVVVNLGNQNVLLLHSHGSIEHKSPLKTVQQLKGRYMAHGVHIDFVIFGHVHESLIADYYARSASLVGANEYSERALNLSGRASQNFYVLSSVDKGFHGLKVDLQDTAGYSGYNIQKQLESYNTKSMAKVSKTTVVHKVEL